MDRPASLNWRADYESFGAVRLSASWRRSFRWSFPQARPSATGPHHLDDTPDLSSENGTRRDVMDGRGGRLLIRRLQVRVLPEAQTRRSETRAYGHACSVAIP
jgi:hypothetical protein